jgi:hypothetical protein
MMDAGRVLAEFRRQVLRSGVVKLTAGFALAVAVLALLGTVAGGRTFIAIELGYYLFPLLQCPYAAHRVLADSDHGMAGVLAATPLKRGEMLIAQLASQLVVSLAAVAVTLPVLAGLFAGMAPNAVGTALVHVPWALAIAGASASFGLVVGHLTSRRPRLGLAIAFVLVGVWFVAGVKLNDIQGQRSLAMFLGKLSPYTYVDLAGSLRPIPAGGLGFLVGPLLLALTAQACLAPAAVGLRNPSGWAPSPGSHPATAVLLGGVLLASGGLLAAWSPPETETPAGAELPIEVTQHRLRWSVTLIPGEEPGKLGRAWGDDTPLRLSMTIVGPPNATLSIDNLTLTSEKIDFEPVDPLPDRIVLDRIQEASDDAPPGTNETVGVETVGVLWTATPTELFQQAPVTLSLAIEGQPTHFDMSLSASGWRYETLPALAGVLATSTSSIAALRWLPSRWNRW